MKKKFLFVFGTRPEAIKMAPVVIEFNKYPDVFETLVCVTAQHRQMLDQVLNLFEIIPDFDLNIMKPDQDLYEVTSKVLNGMRNILQEISPDIVFVQGDTATSVAAALAAFYGKIPVAHIEAGLRTHNRYSPWPEEMNRMLTGCIATWHFAPTLWAKQNLLKENINENQIVITGNTTIDALQWAIGKIRNTSSIEPEIKRLLIDEGYNINRLDGFHRLVLITGHRRENFGDGFQNICYAIKNLALTHPDIDFVYPVHLNPNVRKPVQDILGDNSVNKNVFLINPLQYLPFVYLMSKSYLLLTDSGGIQEEAPSLGKPVLVMRDTTERPEALGTGNILLTGTDRLKIEQAVSSLLNDEKLYKAMSNTINPFGDGKASERIVSFVSKIK